MSNLTPVDLSVPLAPEMNLYAFMREMAAKITHLEIELLEHLVTAGTTRGWFPKLSQLVERFADHEPADDIREALAQLQRRRLLYVADDGETIRSILGGITHERTPISAVSEAGVPFHLLGALDALTIAPMLQKPVTVNTTCAATGARLQLQLEADGHLARTTPATVTAHIPGWDGRASIPDTVSARSRFFQSDAALAGHADVDPEGMMLTEDTLRAVGLQLAHALAGLYVKMSVK